MSDKYLEHKNDLEEQFFHELDKELLANLKEKQKHLDEIEALGHASGISNVEALETINALGITAETLSALTLTPLVMVAWADGNVAQKEKEAILKAAHDVGIEDGSHTYEILDKWLAQKPSDSLMTSWQTYVSAMKHDLDDMALGEFKRVTLTYAKQVAEAAGGFLGLTSKTSHAEKTVIEMLEQAFCD